VIRILLFAIIALAAVFIAARLGVFAGRPPLPLGIRDGKLSPPRTGYPNSVASQHNGNDYHTIAPLRHNENAAQAMRRLREVIASLPGTSIVDAQDNYLYAQFTTPLMRFVDDVEFMPDPVKPEIHLRSASRLGRKDFGTNRKRIETIRQVFENRP
jgi:uncharacterized protein (DUF1499 family)